MEQSTVIGSTGTLSHDGSGPLYSVRKAFVPLVPA